MRITKFPDKCDPNKIMMDTIIKRNSVCPCCGENRLCKDKPNVLLLEGKSCKLCNI